MKKLLFIVSVAVLFSCEKKEIPVPKPIKGNPGAQTIQAGIGSDYGNQIFYNCESNTIVKAVNRESWDLGFESSAAGFHVILNSGKFMGVVKTNKSNLSEVTSHSGTEFLYDAPDGNMNATAIGDWKSENIVYIINMGNTTTGSPIGKYKLKILSADNEKYQIEYAELSQSTSQLATIQKDSQGTFTYFSMKNNEQVSVEPPKDTWDICFRTYTHIYPDGMPYLLVGALINPYQTSVARVNKDFANISYQDYASASMSTNVDYIGFDWKEYSFETMLYTVDPTKIFVMKTSANKVYKLHFLDFYDQTGQKGTTTMEIQEMQE